MCREQEQLYHRAGLQEYMLDTGLIDIFSDILNIGLVWVQDEIDEKDEKNGNG